MSELEQILRLWTQCEEAREQAVLATVVKTQGSSYRLPGARLLVTRAGVRAGSVSGGCLEDDIVKKAWWLTETGPIVQRYDTTPDGEIAGEYGLGCNGIIHVLLERIGQDHPQVVSLIRETRRSRIPSGIAHLLSPREMVGARVVIDPAGHCTHNVPDPFLARSLEEATGIALSDSNGSRLWSDASREAFIETVAPAIRLLIFGAGDDAIALANLAKHFGWEVCVYDGRGHYARPDRFPMADVVSIRQPGMAARLDFDRWTVAVTMSHSYTQDLQVLTELASLSRPPSYVGILGPRKRTDQLLSEAGLRQSAASPWLHSPMGLDIGAEGPDQVALAVTAEIQAVMNRREGGPLCERIGPIHDWDSAGAGAQKNEPVFQPGVCA